MDIEILSDREKVTNWPLSVAVENELPITAALTAIRGEARACLQISLTPSCKGQPGLGFPSFFERRT